MEKQYKAENRRELFLREKSKRFAHDHVFIYASCFYMSESYFGESKK